MNKRTFIKSFGALAVGCMMAGGLSWKPNKFRTFPDCSFRAFTTKSYVVNLDVAEEREALRQFIASHTDENGFWPIA